MSANDADRSAQLGTAALVAGVLSAFGSFMIYATSTFLDPPNVVRIPTMALFPLGLLAALVLGVPAIRGKGRTAAVIGLTCAIAGLALFLYAIFTVAE